MLRYLKGCPGLGIHFVKTSGMFLNDFSDVDWAKCIVTRKSVTDLKIENLLPVDLHCDSNSAIKIAANPVFHERIKHLEIDLHFVREKVLNGVVKTVKVDSANQIAYVFTKGLGTIQHNCFLKKLGMIDIYQFYLIRSSDSMWQEFERLRASFVKFSKIEVGDWSRLYKLNFL
ncbi:hypothetical protein Tco_0495980 [Tanacetum coccineum]